VQVAWGRDLSSNGSVAVTGRCHRSRGGL